MKIVIRVDASRQIGAGHVVRCLTLADALRTCGAQCRFVCRDMPDSLAEMIVARGHELTRLEAASATVGPDDGPSHSSWLSVSQEVDANQTAAVLHSHRSNWLVVDHYALDRRWEQRLRASTDSILAIDDLADREHDCDILLDQNFYTGMATRYSAKVGEHCRVLCGPRYALLREEFRDARQRARPRSGKVRRVLVFLGGMDAANLTSSAIEALARIDLTGIRIDVVIGAEHPYRRDIESACAVHGFTLHVQTARMAELMADSDLAIGAGGSASWERCSVGLPCLVAVVADNQRELVHDSALAGLMYAPSISPSDPDALARHVRLLMENPLLLSSISLNGMSLVDGRGTKRVLQAMGVCRVAVRSATLADSPRIFEWRNDVAIRQVSRSNAPLDWTAHSAWFDSVLANPDRLLLIGEEAGQAVGVVRFDISGDRAEVSIYKVPGRTQPGAGTDLLIAAEQWLMQRRPDVQHLEAEVLGQNQASHRLFGSAGYNAGVTRYTKKVNR